MLQQVRILVDRDGRVNQLIEGGWPFVGSHWESIEGAGEITTYYNYHRTFRRPSLKAIVFGRGAAGAGSTQRDHWYSQAVVKNVIMYFLEMLTRLQGAPFQKVHERSIDL